MSSEVKNSNFITVKYTCCNTALKSSQTPNPHRVEGTAACADQWTECKALRMRNGRRHGRPFNSHECSRRSPTTLEGKMTCSLVHARI